MGLLERFGGGNDSAYQQKQITGKEKSDEDIIAKFDSWYKESEPLYKKRKEWVEKNRKFYLGDYEESYKDMPTWKPRTVHNKIFENVETIVPIMTEGMPEPIGAVNSEDQNALDAVRTVEGALRYIHRMDNLDTKIEQMVRDMLINRDAVIVPMVDYTKDPKGAITTEVLDAMYFRVDPNSTYDQKGNYFFKSVPRTYRWCLTHYPDKREELQRSFGLDATEDRHADDEPENTLHIKEVWYWREEEDGEFHIWKAIYVGKELLSHERNPYWDFDGDANKELDMQRDKAIRDLEESTLVNEGREATEEEKEAIMEEYYKMRTFRNFLEQEELPYIIIPSFPEYSSPFSATSLVEQVSSLQIALNKRTQQIEENANLTGNNQWIIDKDSGIDTRVLTNKPGLVVKKAPGSQAERVSAPTLPSYIETARQENSVAIDNVFGANSISKGQVGNVKTKGEATIMKKADEGRIALLIRHLYAGLEDLYRWHVHLIKQTYDEERAVALFDSAGGFEAYNYISSDTIPDNMQIFVNTGSARPHDQITKQMEADAMFANGALDPITYFKQRGMKDPEGLAEMLDKWRKGTLFEQPQASIEEQAHQENEMLMSAKTIDDMPPNPEANENHIKIHTDLLGDTTKGLTDKQLAILQEHIGVETEALQGRTQEKMQGPAPEQPIPQDLVQQFPEQAVEQAPEGQLEDVMQQLGGGQVPQ